MFTVKNHVKYGLFRQLCGCLRLFPQVILELCTSYPQYVDNLWIGRGWTGDGMWIGGKSEKFPHIHKPEQKGLERRVSSYYIVRESETGSPESKRPKRRFKPVNKGKNPLTFWFFVNIMGNDVLHRIKIENQPVSQGRSGRLAAVFVLPYQGNRFRSMDGNGRIEEGGAKTYENDISAEEKIQSESSRIQSKNEHSKRKKSSCC